MDTVFILIIIQIIHFRYFACSIVNLAAGAICHTYVQIRIMEGYIRDWILQHSKAQKHHK